MLIDYLPKIGVFYFSYIFIICLFLGTLSLFLRYFFRKLVNILIFYSKSLIPNLTIIMDVVRIENVTNKEVFLYD